MQTYTDEIKAQVIAEALMGKAVKAIARERHIPEATVRYWRDTAKVQAQPMLAPQTREDLGQLVYEYLATGLEALIAQARTMGDPEWFKRQGETAHLLHGVLADKLVIIFGGVERGQSTGNDGAG